MLNKKIPFPDIVIVILIITLPFLYYSYRYFPATQIWNGNYFSINAGLFMDVDLFIWLVNIKLLNILLLMIWFISCKHWWKYAILIPLIIECFKFSGVLNVKSIAFDEIEFISSFPITVLFVLLVLFLSKKMNNYSNLQGITTELKEEIDDLFIELKDFDDDKVVAFRKELTKIRNNKSALEINIYLQEILLLRKKIFNI